MFAQPSRQDDKRQVSEWMSLLVLEGEQGRQFLTFERVVVGRPVLDLRERPYAHSTERLQSRRRPTSSRTGSASTPYKHERARRCANIERALTSTLAEAIVNAATQSYRFGFTFGKERPDERL